MSGFLPGCKIGFLGGGQLAQMLTQSCQNLGLSGYVLSENSMDPGAQVTAFWTQGSLDDVKSLAAFLKLVDVATFESEFLDPDKLIEAQNMSGTAIYPHPSLMGQLRDRKKQKKLFDDHKLPTSPWTNLSCIEDLESFIKEHSFPLVLKKRFFGYDGYGTFILKKASQLGGFLKKHWQDDLFIVEKFIPFKKEAAVIIGRSLDGSVTHFPFVESKQTEARCDWVRGPIQGQAYSKILVKLKKFLKQIDYVGVMGVEFFVTSSGLMINEIAPRVHNTGHYSQDTEGLSQFDVHNMCLMGEKLPKQIAIKKSFAMANLIGSGQKVKLKGLPGLHWYGKIDNRKGRKMGHINALGANPKDALTKALKKRRDIKL